MGSSPLAWDTDSRELGKQITFSFYREAYFPPPSFTSQGILQPEKVLSCLMAKMNGKCSQGVYSLRSGEQQKDPSNIGTISDLLLEERYQTEVVKEQHV